MKKIDAIIVMFIQENKYKYSLAICRVLIALILLKKIALQWAFIPLLYTSTDFFVPTNSQATLLFYSFDINFIREHIYIYLSLFILLLIFLLFGIGKNLVFFLIWIMFEIIMRLCPQVLNGGDNYLKFILLYMTFADSFKYLSLENNTSNKHAAIKNFLSNISGLCICIHLCLIYFMSAIHKLHADVWFNGVATYYTFSISRFEGTPWNKILGKNSWFVVLTTYGTLFLELFYPVLVWLKAWKKIMIIGMTLLHVGIGVFMMLYDFQAIFIMAQGFFISNAFWQKQYDKCQAFFGKFITKKAVLVEA